MNCLYQCADLFIHPSLYEGSSIVTLEAMMNGLPVIATNTGGLPDKVRNEYNGWLVHQEMQALYLARFFMLVR